MVYVTNKLIIDTRIKILCLELFSDEPRQKLLKDTILRLENALERRLDVDSAFKELKFIG